MKTSMALTLLLAAGHAAAMDMSAYFRIVDQAAERAGKTKIIGNSVVTAKNLPGALRLMYWEAKDAIPQAEGRVQAAPGRRNAHARSISLMKRHIPLS
ncbi:MAG: hypothetical protein HY549_01895 [Elusimicrobia bacterium]|nr:hypothetical protein [Elusimicrobiota bacterium]